MSNPITKSCRPIIKWAGGKRGLLDQILRHFPKSFNRYIEPFLGSGAIFLTLGENIPALLNDSNSELIHLYRIVRDHPDRLMMQLDQLAARYSEEFYYSVRTYIPQDSIEKAARTLFLNKCGFNGLYRLNSKGYFNVPFGKRPQCPALYERENLLAVSCRLQTAELRNIDFAEMFSGTGQGDVIYCDPPYEPLSQTSRFVSYTSSGFAKAEQERLQQCALEATQRGATVVISNSTAPLIETLYSGWRKVSISARRSINSKGNMRRAISENLFLSPP